MNRASQAYTEFALTIAVYKERPASAPLRNRSISKGYTDHPSISFRPELDSMPVSVIELPTNNSNNYYHTDFEYGHNRFNTLSGEPFPLVKRRALPHDPKPFTIPELSVTEDEKGHEAFQAFLHPDFDPRTGHEITPTSIHHPNFLLKEDIARTSVST